MSKKNLSSPGRSGTDQVDPQGHRKALDALFLLARGCHATLDPNSLLEGILNCLLAIFGADRGFILMAKERWETDSRCPSPQLVPAIVKRVDLAGSDQFSNTVAQEVFSKGAPILVPKVARDHHLRDRSSVIGSGLQWILSAPLMKGTLPIGVIYLDSRSEGRPFEEADLSLLQAAAEHVVAALENSREREQLRIRVEGLAGVVKQEVKREFDTSGIVGSSASMRRLHAAMNLLAPEDTSVLVQGESGTGKELVARAIHDMSPRRNKPFVAVNCMALASGLLESELFGHEKGAFTGAAERHVGRFEFAAGGTLFLDEIGELEQSIQVKLLRVLQERAIQRVGSPHLTPVDVRLVCATHRDLKKAVAEGRFRQDLYYRIAVFPVVLPTLRERSEDILSLVTHFISLFRDRMRKRIHGIEPEALEILRRYSWPGNVRELRNVIERAFVLEATDQITVSSLPFDLTSSRSPSIVMPLETVRGLPLSTARERFERALIVDCLERHKGSITLAAKELQVPRSTIYRKLDAFEVSSGRDE